jgi:hypothetical protein
MIWTIIFIILYQCITGVVEGIKNTLVLKPLEQDNYYHIWRLLQGLFICLAVLSFPGFSIIYLEKLLLAWIGGDGIYNRIVCWISHGSLIDPNGDVFRIGPFVINHLPVWSDFIRFILFTLLSFIL